MINEAKRAAGNSAAAQDVINTPNIQPAIITTGYMQQVPFKSMAELSDGVHVPYNGEYFRRTMNDAYGASQGQAAIGQVQSGYYPAYTDTLPPFSHQPFTLEWNGSKYVPDFIPEHIRITGYYYKDYQELKNAYRKEKSIANRYHEMDKRLDGYVATYGKLIEEIQLLHLQLDAYRMVWSAREYLKQTDKNNYEAYHTLSDAMMDIHHEAADWNAIRAKYANLDTIPGINTPSLDSSLRGKCEHMEDRSI